MADPTKSSLLRDFYVYIIDHNWTPYVVADAEIDGVFVPKEHINNGKIVLDIAPDAANGIRIGDDAIEFDARFSSQIWHIYLPISAVVIMYAKETNTSIIFAGEHNTDETKTKSSHLKLVK